jgi:hypothetical protein
MVWEFPEWQKAESSAWFGRLLCQATVSISYQ